MDADIAPNWLEISAMLSADNSAHEIVTEVFTRISRVETSDGSVYYFKQRLTENGEFLADEEDDLTPEDEASFNQRITALQRGAGHQALEQLVSYSRPESAFVTHSIPGRQILEMTGSDLLTIPSEHFLSLLMTFEDMQSRHIALDIGPDMSNMFYDQEQGFMIIDYLLAPDHEISHPVLMYLDFIADFHEHITNAKINQEITESQAQEILNTAINELITRYGQEASIYIAQYIGNKSSRRLWVNTVMPSQAKSSSS